MDRGWRWFLGASTAAVVVAFSKLHAVGVGHYDITSSGRFPWLTAFVAVLVLSAYAFGLPDQAGEAGPKRALFSAALANSAAAGVISILELADGATHLPRFVVFSSSAVLVPAYAAIALVATRGRRRVTERERVLAVGSEEDTLGLIADLSLYSERPAQVVRSLSVDDARGAEPHDSPLVAAARDTRATVVVLSNAAQADNEVVAQAAELHAAGVRVRTLSDFYDEWLGKLPLSELERAALLFDIRELHGRHYARVKRLGDIAVALVALPVLLLAIPATWLCNRIGNRGPLFFRQPRTGKNGETFQILKFRTMIPATATNAQWTQEDDPRITPVGRWLRKTHIDELPQLLNILRGDLSFVGPRPEQPHYVADLVEKIPFYALRHAVRPGLTGWAQVKYPYGASDLDAMEKLQYEFCYLRHQSLTLDACILVRTLRSVIGRAGR